MSTVTVVSLYGLEMFLEFDWVGGRRVLLVTCRCVRFSEKTIGCEYDTYME